MVNMLSTTAIAKELGTDTREIFDRLLGVGLIVRNEGKWELTTAGRQKGGITKKDAKYGEYILWPESLVGEIHNKLHGNGNLKTATSLGNHFGLSANRMNYILAELGWIENDVKGWRSTASGKRLGAVQARDKVSGVPYVRWPDSIINNGALVAVVNEAKGKSSNITGNQVQDNADEIGFREKFPAKLRATDGHFVRSKAELLIDNWLYPARIVHAYERKLPVEEDLYSDFYIPAGNVYIEYWGLESDPYYSARKAKKLEIYQKYGFNLIELTDKEMNNLDDNLPRLLLKFGIKTE
jgi:hypothetical protein